MRNLIILLSSIFILCIASIAQGPLISTGLPQSLGTGDSPQFSAIGINAAPGAAGSITTGTNGTAANPNFYETVSGNKNGFALNSSNGFLFVRASVGLLLNDSTLLKVGSA